MRDRLQEENLLAGAQTMAHQVSGDFGRRVLARVERAGRHFGREIPDHLTIAELLAEIREEAEDMAGWSLMTLAVAREHQVPVAVRRRLYDRLERASAFAAMADREIAEALEELRG